MKLLSKYEFLKAVSNSLIQTISGIFSQNPLEVHSLLKKFVAFTCTLSSTYGLIENFYNNIVYLPLCSVLWLVRSAFIHNIYSQKILLLHYPKVLYNYIQLLFLYKHCYPNPMYHFSGGIQYEIYRYAPSHNSL